MQNIATLLVNYACTKMIDASVLLYFSFGSSLLQSRSMEQDVPAVHLTFYHLAVVIRDMSDIYRYSDHSLLPLSYSIPSDAIVGILFNILHQKDEHVGLQISVMRLKIELSDKPLFVWQEIIQSKMFIK